MQNAHYIFILFLYINIRWQIKIKDFKLTDISNPSLQTEFCSLFPYKPVPVIEVAPQEACETWSQTLIRHGTVRK